MMKRVKEEISIGERDGPIHQKRIEIKDGVKNDKQNAEGDAEGIRRNDIPRWQDFEIGRKRRRYRGARGRIPGSPRRDHIPSDTAGRRMVSRVAVGHAPRRPGDVDQRADTAPRRKDSVGPSPCGGRDGHSVPRVIRMV